MLDFHGKGAGFKLDLMGDVQDMVGRMLSNVNASIAVQKEGVVQSDQHRVLDFTGAGVTVTDDPTSRRTVIAISGAASSPRVTVVASTVGQGFVIISASTPANDGAGKTWRQVGYAHAGWIATLAETYAYPGFSQIPGAVFVCPLDGTVSNTQVFWLHHEFTLASSQLSSGILDFVLDGSGEVYINDTLVATQTDTHPTAYFSVTVPAGLLVSGTNVIACRVANQFGASGPNPSSAEYRITVQDAGSATLSANLASDSAAFNTTPFSVMSLTLTPGTWLMFANAVLVVSGAAGSIGMELTDGTNHFGSAGATTAAAGFSQSLHVSSEPIVVASGTLVVNMSCVAQSNATAKAATPQGALPKGTYMRALRVA